MAGRHALVVALRWRETMVKPTSIAAEGREQGRLALAASAAGLGVGLALLIIARGGGFPPWMERNGVHLAAVLFVACGVTAWVLGAHRSDREDAARHAIPGMALLGVAASFQWLYPPTWPALLVLALGAAGGLCANKGPWAAGGVALAALAFQSLPALGRPWSDVPSVVGLACASAAVPMLLEAWAWAGQRTRVRAAKDAVDQRLRALDEDARAYRLIASTTRSDLPLEVRDQRRRVGSVQTIGESVYALLEVATRALEPHTCALFLLDPSGTELKIQELITRSDFVKTGSLAADKGVLGNVVKKREPVRLHHLPPDFPGVTWYHPPDPPRSLLAVPVLEGEHLRGVLVVDWKEDREPSAQQTSLLNVVAREVVRTTETELLLAQLDRARVLTDRLYGASREFIGAVTLPQTFQVALATARAVSDATVAVLALQDEGRITIAAVDGLGPEVVGRQVVDDSGVITACMRNQVVLPHGAGDPQRLRQLLGPETPLPGVEAVRVLPFIEKRESVGVLVVGAPRKNAFPQDVDERLRVTADMAAMGIANARLYARLERMATTDGLTGLLNHRTFQERFSDVLRRAERYGRHVAFFLTDIDHFKSVNDTYGHPVGDVVLRHVASMIRNQMRATDIVARYGGEEFAVVMDETDAAGAYTLAERVRAAIASTPVPTDMGSLKVTLSLGVAAFPTHGTEKHTIIERADQALYEAKHGGRNRAVLATPVDPAPQPQPVEKS